MHVLSRTTQLHAARRGLAGRVAFVPTMGALHAGHAALVRHARQLVGGGGGVIASIFVNPTQFNDSSDLAAYPRTAEADLTTLQANGCDLAWTPGVDDIYTPGVAPAVVDVPSLTSLYEGLDRPGHFAGVCRVVMILLNAVRPDLVVFGEKDFQQLAVVKAMVRSLHVPTDVVGHPTVRDADGLALSSRNARLTPDARAQALAIPRALSAAAASRKDVRPVETAVRDALVAAHLDVHYVRCVDADTFAVARARPARLLVAATVGGVRLLDNAELPA